MAKELSDKERIFVVEYVATLDVSEAAKAAQYAPSTARDLLLRPHVREMVDTLLEQKASIAGRTAKDVLDKLWENIGLAQKAGAYAAATSGLKLYMTHLGMFPSKEDGVGVSPVMGTAIQINIGRDAQDKQINAEIVAGRTVVNSAPKAVPGRADGAGSVLVPPVPEPVEGRGDGFEDSGEVRPGDSVRALRGGGVRGEELWAPDGDA